MFSPDRIRVMTRGRHQEKQVTLVVVASNKAPHFLRSSSLGLTDKLLLLPVE